MSQQSVILSLSYKYNDLLLEHNNKLIEHNSEKEVILKMLYDTNMDNLNLKNELNELKIKYDELKLMHDAAVILKKMKN